MQKPLKEVRPEKVKLPASLIAGRFPMQLHDILELASTIRHFDYLFGRTVTIETLSRWRRRADSPMLEFHDVQDLRCCTVRILLDQELLKDTLQGRKLHQNPKLLH